MNVKTCATSDVAKAWDSIDWNKAEAYVKKLQMRIVRQIHTVCSQTMYTPAP